MRTRENLNKYRLWLHEELSARKQNNPSYSLRAFSRSLGLSSATLSQIMTGSRPMSLKMASRIAESCGLSPDERKTFLAGLLPSAALHAKQKQLSAYEVLDVDAFHVISDWFHYAILGLCHFKENRASALWISKKLGITQPQARAAFERLRRLGLLRLEAKQFRQTTRPLVTPPGISSGAVRSFHSQMLDKARVALESLPPSKRYFSNLTLAADPRAMSEVSQMIDEFVAAVNEKASKQQKKQVFSLAIQWFPISK